MDIGTTLAEARQAFERGFVRAALGRAVGRPGLAAKELGLSRKGLTKLMTRLDLRRGDEPSPFVPLLRRLHQ